MGRVTRMDYPHGWVEEYEYDAIGQLLNVTDSDPSGKDMKQQKHVYRYDDCGNMTYEYMRGNGTGEATVENDYSYDALHRVVRAEEHFGHEVREYTYDSLGNLTYEKDSHNYYVDYILNDLNQIVESSTDGWKTRTTYTYDGRGNLTEKVYGKNKKVTTTAEYIFDETNKMVLGYNALRESSAYTYNGLGALVTNTWTIAKNGYGYHDVDALASEAEVLSGQELMEALEVYDEAELTDVVKFHHFGDELAPNLEAPTVEEEVSAAPALSDDPAEPDAGVEAASANGNSAGNNGQGNGNSSNNGNGNGSINKTSTVVKNFVVDYNTETFEPLMEHEVNGLDYKYVYGNDRLSVDISPINSSGKLIENGDHIRLYYHMDYLGTADYLTSPVSGKVEAWTHYNEWGLISHNAVLKCGQRELDLVKRYATHDYDSVLELYYAKARFYDAHDRRFTAVDPILDPSQYDLREYVHDPIRFAEYLYADNIPTVYVDKTGKLAVSQYDDFAKGMVDYAGGFFKTLELIGNAVLHPVETVKTIINTVKSIGSALKSGSLTASSIAKAFGNIAFEAFVGDIVYIGKHFNQFFCTTKITDAQARELGRRTIGAVVQAISLFDAFKAIKANINSKAVDKIGNAVSASELSNTNTKALETLGNVLPANKLSNANTNQILRTYQQVQNAASANQTRLTKILNKLKGNKNFGLISGRFGQQYVSTWHDAELIVRNMLGAKKGQRFINPVLRQVDVYNQATGVIAEVKTGYITLTRFVRSEIARDLAILNDPSNKVTRIEWHFFSEAGKLGTGGPAQPLLEELIKNGIIVVFH